MTSTRVLIVGGTGFVERKRRSDHAPQPSEFDERARTPYWVAGARPLTLKPVASGASAYVAFENSSSQPRRGRPWSKGGVSSMNISYAFRASTAKSSGISSRGASGALGTSYVCAGSGVETQPSTALSQSGGAHTHAGMCDAPSALHADTLST